MARTRTHLVDQQIERVQRRLLEEHPSVLREYVKGKRGVYALYKGTRLYYVGLASNLRGRLKQHLRDRHASAWDYFSMYLTTSDDQLRELEALVLRITMPKGNKSKTKFLRSVDLRRSFWKRIEESQRTELENLFRASEPRQPRAATLRPPGRKSTLGPYVKKAMRIRKVYKGKTYSANVLADGRIRFGGKVYTSPSLAASSLTKRAMNGWHWWKFEARPGKWAPLESLRKGH